MHVGRNVDESYDGRGFLESRARQQGRNMTITWNKRMDCLSLFFSFLMMKTITLAHTVVRTVRCGIGFSGAAFVKHVDLGGPRHCHSNNEIARAGSGNDVHVRFVRCRDTSWKIACDGIAMFQDSRDDFNLQIKRIIRIYTMKFTPIAGYFYIAWSILSNALSLF